jgi:hypothetical protein
VRYCTHDLSQHGCISHSPSTTPLLSLSALSPVCRHPECVFSRPLLLDTWQRQRRSTSLPTAAQTPTTQTMTPFVVKELIPTSDHSPSILPTIDLPRHPLPLIFLLSMARHPTTFSTQPDLLFPLIVLYLP